MKLTPEQEQAITNNKSTAVIASAGTGKTTVLTQRFLHSHFKNSVPLSQILAFTFTEKAAQEMKTRLINSDKLAPHQAPLLNISTIHSFCHALLAKHGHHLGLSDHFEVLDDFSHRLWLEREIRSWIHNEIQNGSKALTKFCKHYGYQNLLRTATQLAYESLVERPLSKINTLNRDTEVDAKNLIDFLQLNHEFQELFLQKKVSQDMLSFDDLEILCLRLLNQHREIVHQLNKRFQHVLVDEYQDISPRQFELIKLLYHPEHNQLFIVGDPKQSIYGFRNANVELFEQTAELIQNHGGQTVYLTHTFRTPKKLQDYFNSVFPQVLGQKQFQPAITHKNTEAFLLAPGIDFTDKNAEQQHLAIANHVASHIKNLYTNNPQESYAILFYAKGPLKHYQSLLEEQGVPTITETKRELFEHPLTASLWHILLYISGSCHDQYEQLSQVGILRSPFFQFSESFIDHLLKSQSDKLFCEQTLDLFASNNDCKRWEHLMAFLDRLDQLKDKLFLKELAQTVLDEFPINIPPRDTQFLQSFLTTLDGLHKQGIRYAHQAYGTLKDMDRLELTANFLDIPENGIYLLSIHAAKGLEFDHVFLVPGKRRPGDAKIYASSDQGFVFKSHDCEHETTLKYKLDEPKTYLAFKEQQQEKDQAELSRLVYVALTRAKTSLWVYAPPVPKTLQKHFLQDSLRMDLLTNYNHWLMWLSFEIRVPDCENSVLRERVDSIDPYDRTHLEQTEELSPKKEAVCSTPSFSVTEFETFINCPKKFELKYLEGLRSFRHVYGCKEHSKKTPQSKTKKLSARERGNLIHEVLQYHDYTTNQGLETVVERALFNQGLSLSPNRLIKDCQNILNKLHNHELSRELLFNPQEVFSEWPFEISLGNFSLTGQIDRLVSITNPQGQKEWVVIDYKTHRIDNPEHIKTLAKEYQFQLNTYALACLQALELSNIKTLLIFVEGPHFHLTEHGKEDLAAFKNKLTTLYQGIHEALEHNDFGFAQEKSYCQHCGYFKDNICGIKGD